LWFPQNPKVADILRVPFRNKILINCDNLQKVQISNDSELM
jgi:hypothetical protein